MYFTDRGIEELVERRGEESVTLEWVGDQLKNFADGMDPDVEAFTATVEEMVSRLCARVPWMAARDAPGSHPAASQEAVFGDRLFLEGVKLSINGYADVVGKT